MEKLGIALGAGGAKGFAHIPILEVLDDFGLTPYKISGSSIGAIIGAYYASGLSAKEIHDVIDQRSHNGGDNIATSFFEKDLFKWFEYLDFDWRLNFNIDLTKLIKEINCSTFEELKIPLKVVAANFWERNQVIFESGELKQAIQASAALPGIIKPVIIEEQALIDGGAVNPVPFDIIDDCDFIIAVNVMGNRSISDELTPSTSEAIFNTFQIMQNTILSQKLAVNPPDILLEPDIVDIKALEFYKADEIFKQAAPCKEHLKRQIGNLLENKV